MKRGPREFSSHWWPDGAWARALFVLMLAGALALGWGSRPADAMSFVATCYFVVIFARFAFLKIRGARRRGSSRQAEQSPYAVGYVNPQLQYVRPDWAPHPQTPRVQAGGSSPRPPSDTDASSTEAAEPRA